MGARATRITPTGRFVSHRPAVEPGEPGAQRGEGVSEPVRPRGEGLGVARVRHPDHALRRGRRVRVDDAACSPRRCSVEGDDATALADFRRLGLARSNTDAEEGSGSERAARFDPARLEAFIAEHGLDES